MKPITDKPLPDKDDEELAVRGERNDPLSAEGILLDKEWKRRLMKEQHELDLKLIAKQVRWMKFSAILGVLAVLAGAIVGAYLQYMWSQQPLINKQPIIQYKIDTSSATPSDRPRDTKIILQEPTKEKDSSTSYPPPKEKHEQKR